MPDFLYTSVDDSSGAPNTVTLDGRAKTFFAETNLAAGGGPLALDEFWFICFKVVYAGPSYAWAVYAFSDLVKFTDDGVTSPVPGAQDIAQGLKDAGFDVVLRHYTAADVTFTASNITLT